MADKQIIAASIQVTSGNSNAEIKEVNKNLKDVKNSLGDTGKAAKASSSELGATGTQFGKIKDQMSGLPGPLGQAGDGVNKLSSTFKALLANPVALVLTAIVGVLALLYKAFTNTFAGGQKMEQVFAGIKAAGQALIDNIAILAGAAVKLFNFDFSGAVADIKGVAKEAGGAFNKMAELTKEAQALRKEQADNDLDQQKRAAKLADLRAKVDDPATSAKERRIASEALYKEAQQNAKDDIDLANRTAENKKNILLVEKEGAEKNYVEIKEIEADQFRNQTENSNEIKRAGKLVTGAKREEAAQQKEIRAKAAEEEKADRLKLAEFNSKLTAIQQSNALARIKDGYDKELASLNIKNSNEKIINDQAFKDKKITKTQQAALDNELDVQLNLQKADLEEKHNLEKAKKEEDFQKDILATTNRIKLNGITDARQLEKVQLQIGYEEKLKAAVDSYKNDQEKFAIAKALIDQELKESQDKIDAKNKIEDDKKKLDDELKKNAGIMGDPDSSFKDKQAALDADVAANQAAYDAKTITEEQYLQAKKANTHAGKELDKAELASKLNTIGLVGDALGSLSKLVGENTKAGKAFAVAQSTISMIQGAVSSYTSLSGIPVVGPVLGAIAAAAAVAAGVANIKKITAVQVPGGGGGGGGVATPLVPTAPLAPTLTQVSTTLNQDSINSIGDATSGRAYVVDADVRDNRERNERLSRAARLGG